MYSNLKICSWEIISVHRPFDNRYSTCTSMVDRGTLGFDEFLVIFIHTVSTFIAVNAIDRGRCCRAVLCSEYTYEPIYNNIWSKYLMCIIIIIIYRYSPRPLNVMRPAGRACNRVERNSDGSIFGRPSRNE